MDYRARKRKRQNPIIPTQASFYVQDLPGLEASSLSLFSGHLPSDDAADSHLFFLLSRNLHIAKKERLLIFLNGGKLFTFLADLKLGYLNANPSFSL